MLTRLADWLDRRTGHRKVVRVLLLEHIPGGARWRYVWGSCLAFVFLLQLITGLLLMTAYSPSDTTAWSSVFFIQYQMDFGWFIRGLHHFGSQAMVVLLAVHMLQVVIAGAQLPPREVNWWLGLGLLGAVLGLSLTGYLLPWDQKGYWATQVATNIAGNLPTLGSEVKKFAVGGPAYGHHTLTRFYTLHVALLPPLVVVLIILHLVVFRRHGVTAPKDAEGTGWFWPEQAFRDMVISMAVFAVLIGVVLWGHANPIPRPADAPPQSLYERWARAGQEGLGADLDAPADPATESYPARPEWYFLFLFQLLKYFPGEQEVIGTVFIPMGVGLVLFLLPLLGFGRMRPVGHIVGILVVVGLFTAVGALTCQALADDLADPVARGLVSRVGRVVVPVMAVLLLALLAGRVLLRPGGARRAVVVVGTVVLVCLGVGAVALVLAAVDDNLPDPVASLVESRMSAAEKEVPPNVVIFQQKRRQADAAAERAVTLAAQGIPEDGAKLLLRRDPLTQGPGLFRKHCATCHTHKGVPPSDLSFRPTASDLTGFGTKEWLTAFLQNPGGEKFLGRVKDKEGANTLTEMAGWVKKKRRKAGAKGRGQLDRDFAEIAAWLARHPQGTKWEKDTFLTRGYQKFNQYQCTDCHRYSPAKEEEQYKAPDLTGYGSADWLRLMVMSPGHPWRYGEKNRMPAFRDLQGAAGKVAQEEYAAAAGKLAEWKSVKIIDLSQVDRELIIRWLTGDDRVVFGGAAISGPQPAKP